jgi:GDP-L-fucose synthase
MRCVNRLSFCWCGTPRKLVDSSRFNALGWKPHVALEAGLKAAYQNFIGQVSIS